MHSGSSAPVQRAPLALFGCSVDQTTGSITKAGALPSQLTSRDLQLLTYLVKHTGRDVSRAELLREVWQYSERANTRATDNAVKRLRAKLEVDATRPQHLLTVRGVGYRFVGLGVATAPTPRAPSRVTTFVLGDAEVDLSRLRLVRGAMSRILSRREAQLLGVLFEANGESVERARLHRAGWPSNPPLGRALDQAIRRLRKKLEPDPKHPEYLHTTPGGFSLSTGPRAQRLRPQATRFVARDDELARLDTALQRPTLVTLKGCGGIGKTRMARQAARRFDAGPVPKVWFCELQDAEDYDALVRSIARALDLGVGKSAVAVIGRALAARGPGLLVLDNFEQVVHCAPLIHELQTLAPEIRILVTSRERLRVPGERVIELTGLLEDASVELMIDRAQLLGVQVENTHELRALARCVEGIPLALELAAARFGLLTPAQITERLGRTPDLLGHDLRTRATRHQSLRACLSWSLNLCAPEERRALAQLSVFCGGFTVEAAEAVVTVAPGLELLQQLLDKSLLIRRNGRMYMLDSIRRFVRSTDANRSESRERHYRYYATFGDETAMNACRGPTGHHQRTRTAFELENVLAAFASAFADQAQHEAVCTLRAAWMVLMSLGPMGMAIDLADQLLSLPSLTTVDRGHGLRVRGCARITQGQFESALFDLTEAYKAFTVAGETRWAADVMVHMGHVHRLLDTPLPSESALKRGLQSYESLGDRIGMAQAMAQLGRVYAEWPPTDPMAGERRDQVDGLFDRSVSLIRQAGERTLEAWILANIAATALNSGNLPRSRACSKAALVIQREVGHRGLMASSLHDLGLVCCMEGDLSEGVVFLEQSLELAREAGSHSQQASCLVNLGEAEAILGHRDRAIARYRMALAEHPEDVSLQDDVSRKLAALLPA